jgi:hypothetical protein
MACGFSTCMRRASCGNRIAKRRSLRSAAESTIMPQERRCNAASMSGTKKSKKKHPKNPRSEGTRRTTPKKFIHVKPTGNCGVSACAARIKRYAATNVNAEIGSDYCVVHRAINIRIGTQP